MITPLRSIEASETSTRAVKLAWIGLALAYGWVTIAFASRRRLWYDELLVVHLAGLADFATFWDASEHGPDLNPPLHHLAVRGLLRWLKDGPEIARLPSVVGFGVMVFGLYRFASRRVGAASAWPAALLPFATRAYDYAIEARPYAMVLGASGLALCFWQDAADGVRRRLSILGLALSLAAAVSSHFYAVLIFLPIAAGELVRSWGRKRLDPPVWAALAAGASALGLLGPWIVNARGRMHDFWSRPVLEQVPVSYSWLLTYQGTFLVVLFAVVGALRLRRGCPGNVREDEDVPAFPSHEKVAVAGFVLLPVWAFLLAELVTKAYTPRYTLPAILGLSLLVPILLDRGRPGPAHSAALTLILAGWIAIEQAGRLARPEDPDSYTRFRAAVSLDGHHDRPIVVADPIEFLQVVRYIPARAISNLYYLNTDSGKAGELSAQRELGCLRRWIPLPCMDLATFLGAHRRFHVFGAANSGLLVALMKERSRWRVITEGPDLHRVEGIDIPTSASR